MKNIPKLKLGAGHNSICCSRFWFLCVLARVLLKHIRTRDGCTMGTAFLSRSGETWDTNWQNALIRDDHCVQNDLATTWA